jgi:Holliday junction DNA helicase RuvA
LIGRLVGSVALEEPTGAMLLDVGGVGYELMTPVGTLGRAARDDAGRVTLFVHTHVREDALDLFGFAAESDRRVFRLLIEVPNVGPRTALGLLSALPVEELSRCVDQGDVARLTKVPGIGKKTAERLVLELKERLPKLGLVQASPAARPTGGDDARKLLTALTNMGYRAAEAERAVKSLGERVGSEPLATLLREALARLTP